MNQTVLKHLFIATNSGVLYLGHVGLFGTNAQKCITMCCGLTPANN